MDRRRTGLHAFAIDAFAIAALTALAIFADMPSSAAAGLILAVVAGRLNPVGPQPGGPPLVPPSGVMTIVAGVGALMARSKGVAIAAFAALAVILATSAGGCAAFAPLARLAGSALGFYAASAAEGYQGAPVPPAVAEEAARCDGEGGPTAARVGRLVRAAAEAAETDVKEACATMLVDAERRRPACVASVPSADGGAL